MSETTYTEDIVKCPYNYDLSNYKECPDYNPKHMCKGSCYISKGVCLGARVVINARPKEVQYIGYCDTCGNARDSDYGILCKKLATLVPEDFFCKGWKPHEVTYTE